MTLRATDKEISKRNKIYLTCFKFKCLLNTFGILLGQISISLEMAQGSKSKDTGCKPGWNFCCSCIQFLSKYNEAADTKIEVEVVDNLIFDKSESSKKQILDTSLSAIGISPLKLHGIAQHQQIVTAKRKLGRAYTKMKEGVVSVYKVNN